MSETFTYEEAKKACLEYFDGDEIASDACISKYLLRDGEGNLLEKSPNDYLAYRIANEFKRIEDTYPNPLTLNEIRVALGGISNEDLEKNPELKKKLGYGPVVCQGSPTFGIGNPYKVISLSNCFCIGQPADSWGGICLKDQEIAQVSKRRGGIGACISSLRPKGMLVKNSAVTSDGIAVFMDKFSETSKGVAQGGRRGALMLCLDCRHPEILTFINIKRDLKRVTGANISVKWHDDFFETLEKDGKYMLRFPVDVLPENAKIVKEVDAKDIWNAFISSAWESAEPGCFYWDTMIGQSITDEYASDGFATIGTNPCVTGETLVYVADGRGNVPIKQLAEEGKDIPVFCYDDKGKIAIRTMRNPRVTGYNQQIYKVKLDDGYVVRCTGNHKFRLIDGSYKEARDLVFGDSLKTLTKYEASIKDIFPEANSNSQDYFWINNGFASCYSEHRIIMENFLGRKINTGEVVHHIDYNAKNNSLDNLKLISRDDHNKLHCQNMFGEKNPMRRAKTEWSEERWNQYSENMSKAVKGDKNGRYLDITNDELLEKAIELTEIIGRRFSKNEWQDYAKNNSIPIEFSEWRKEFFGSVVGLAKMAAEKCGFDHLDDPRLVDTLVKMTDMGYDASIKNHEVFVKKQCERCGKDFEIQHGLREISFCSQLCGSLEVLRKNGKSMTEKSQLWYENRSIKLKNDQCSAFTTLKNKLSRVPQKKEWEKECKSQNIPFRLGTKYGFSTFSELTEKAELYNHRVVSVELDVIEDVYNGTVDNFHNFFVGAFESKTKNGKRKWLYINGLQCGELPLGEYGSCILMLLNLPLFVSNSFYPDSKFNWDMFDEFSKKAARLIDDLVDLEIEKIKQITQKVESDPESEFVKAVELSLWKKVLDISEKGRKTGLGVTGLADMLAALNIKYSSQEAVDFCDTLFKRFQENVYFESSILAKERGHFPCWKWENEKDNYYIKKLPDEIQEHIKMYGRRNIASLTMSPAGTTSLMTRSTSGVEPLYKHSLIRRKKLAPDEESRGVKPNSIDEDGNKWVHYEILHPGFSKWLQVSGKDCFCDSPYSGSEAYELDPMFRVKLQGVLQSHTDNSISSTLNLPKTTTKEQVSEIYLAGWEEGLKGLTIYRDGSRDGVLISSTKRPDLISDSQAPKRPDLLKCEIHTSIIKGTEWVFMVGMLEGRPYEIFGGKYSSMIIPKKFIKGRDSTDAVIRKNGKNSAGFSTYDLLLGTTTTTTPSEFKDIASVFSPDNGSPTRLVSMLLRHGVPINDICEQIRKIPQEDSMLTFEKGISRVLRKYVADKTMAKGRCPECQSKLLYEGGCVKCSQCSWSRCD